MSEARKLAAKEPGRENAQKRERVRCSSLVDWPVYPRLRGTMQGSTRSRNKPMRQGRITRLANFQPFDAERLSLATSRAQPVEQWDEPRRCGRPTRLDRAGA
jgi:hypothetical protein